MAVAAKKASKAKKAKTVFSAARNNPRVLVVEDSKFFGVLIQNQIQQRLGYAVDWVKSHAEALEIMNLPGPRFTAALVDLNLPDASGDRIVDLVVSAGIPTVAFSGEYSEELREIIWSYRVVDYVMKEGFYNIDYILFLMERIHRNPQIQVMVVDDSAAFRTQISELLRVHQYRVLEAQNGKEALDVLGANPGIRLILADYDMPEMDGLRMVSEIRKTHSKERLAIIGISGMGNRLLSARFIKNGANDFLCKPFVTEEFYCRVSQNIQMLEHVDAVKRASITDYLTGLCNRRYLFEVGEKLFANARRENISLTVGMLDLDHFKKINDKYGHEAGDRVLKAVADLLKERFRESDVIARYGGEEFCLLLPNMDRKDAAAAFEALREQIEKLSILVPEGTIHPTASMGVNPVLQETLEASINRADALLYKAKTGGRNRVVMARK